MIAVRLWADPDPEAVRLYPPTVIQAVTIDEAARSAVAAWAAEAPSLWRPGRHEVAAQVGEGAIVVVSVVVDLANGTQHATA